MRVGFIAMSGVRAWSEELNRAGLTMPGVIERGQVIASLPSLSLLTLAGLTGPDCEVSYHEIRDLRAEGCGGLPDRFDLVAISSMTAQIQDAYAVADEYRRRGAKVVMGGLHVTALPREALRHCDAVVVGEGEPMWARVIQDARRGQLRMIYARKPEDPEFDLADAPMPRFDLLNPDRYNRIPIQTARGCPHRCEFCASSILLTAGYKCKPAEKVEAELRAIREVWDAPFIELADDNSFCSRAHALGVLGALKRSGVSWFTECDIAIAKDPQLLHAMREAGCRQVLVGLESPVETGLGGLELRRDWKLKQFPKYEAAVREIHAHGITVNGCFIVGLDGHDHRVFDAVYDFAMRMGLWDVQITVPTAFPGTPMYERLLAQGRLLHPGVWSACTLLDVNIVPAQMTPDELAKGFLELARRLYAPENVEARRRSFLAQRRAG